MEAITRTKVKGTVRKSIGILIIPLLTFLVMEIACLGNGTTLFANFGSTMQIFFRGIAIVLLLAFGVSINMHTGRFDFSTGAVMLIGGVVGAKLAVAMNLGPIGMIIISGLTGALVGGLTGFLYVLFKLPPMIIGLGMTLILEGITAIISDGCQPVNFGTDASYFTFATNIPALLIIISLALALMIILFHFTKFGYDYRALQTGQKIAVNTGVNEKRNAIICYTISGLMFGISGALTVMRTNGVTPTINFSTIGSMFSCFLPLFFAGFINKYTNKQIAILLGCIAYEFIQIGFGQITSVNASFSVQIRSVVEAIILVGFLIYVNNETPIIEFVMLKKLRARLKEKKDSAALNGEN